MKPMGMFVSTLFIIDTFMAAYYVGMHSRTVKIVDPSMKPVSAPVAPPKLEAKQKALPADSRPPGTAGLKRKDSSKSKKQSSSAAATTASKGGAEKKRSPAAVHSK